MFDVKKGTNRRDSSLDRSKGYYQHPLAFQKGLSIASLNINGLRGHLDEIQQFLHSSSIHVLALNETKLDPHYPNELLSVPRYQHQRLDRTCNGGSSPFLSGTHWHTN